MEGRESWGPGRWIVSDPTLNPGPVVICSLVPRSGFTHTPWFDARQYWIMLHLQISGNGAWKLETSLLPCCSAASTSALPKEATLADSSTRASSGIKPQWARP